MHNFDGTKMESDLKAIPKGVLQGSILETLFFILYSSDLVKCIRHYRYHLYADDLQIYIYGSVDCLNSMVCGVNDDLSRISA